MNGRRVALAALVLSSLGVLVVRRIRRAQEIARARGVVGVSGKGGNFSEERIDGLPEVGRRFFRSALAPGVRLPGSARLSMNGSIGLRPGSDKLPFTAEQVISRKGLVWEAQVGSGWLRIEGADSYDGGRGGMAWSLWDLIPIVRASGPDVTRSAAGRLALELGVFLPSALLPQEGVQWEEVDSRTARVSLDIDGEVFRPTLVLDDAGRLVTAEMLRWDPDASDGVPGLVRWRASLDRHEKFDGMTIPTRLHVTKRWGTPQADTFFEATITAASFR